VSRKFENAEFTVTNSLIGDLQEIQWISSDGKGWGWTFWDAMQVIYIMEERYPFGYVGNSSNMLSLANLWQSLIPEQPFSICWCLFPCNSQKALNL